MTVSVQLFSRLRDLAGRDRLTIDLPEGATLGDLLARVYGDYPAIAAWESSLLFAVGLEFVDRQQILRPGDVVSIMPPVQGG